MKKLLIATLLIFCAFVQDVAASTPPVRSTLREKQIPEWVKKRLNPGQYGQLEKLSSYYKEIDYTLFRRRDLDTTGLYIRLSDAVKNAEYNPERATSVSFMPRGKVVFPYNEEQIVCEKKKGIVYSSIDGYDAHVEIEFCYYMEQDVPVLLYWKASAKSFSGIPVRYEEQEMEQPDLASFFSYQPDRKVFQGWLIGTLTFTDADGNEHMEGVGENFDVGLE